MVFSINKLNTNNQGVFYDDSQKNMINLKGCDSLNRVKIKREDYNYNNNITLKKKNYLSYFAEREKNKYAEILLFLSEEKDENGKNVFEISIKPERLSNGLRKNHIENLKKWINSKRFVDKSQLYVFFDWDLTISVYEGFYQLSKDFNKIGINREFIDYYEDKTKITVNEDELKRDFLLFILGGKERFNMLIDMYNFLSEKGVNVFIVTNNDTAEGESKLWFLSIINLIFSDFRENQLIYSGVIGKYEAINRIFNCKRNKIVKKKNVTKKMNSKKNIEETENKMKNKTRSKKDITRDISQLNNLDSQLELKYYPQSNKYEKYEDIENQNTVVSPNRNIKPDDINEEGDMVLITPSQSPLRSNNETSKGTPNTIGTPNRNSPNRNSQRRFSKRTPIRNFTTKVFGDQFTEVSTDSNNRSNTLVNRDTSKTRSLFN
tara:strand:+ start:4375 stop:5676 length:1302 start_codon:yes stop_codon:yes gene_type:complete